MTTKIEARKRKQREQHLAARRDPFLANRRAAHNSSSWASFLSRHLLIFCRPFRLETRKELAFWKHFSERT